MRGEFSFRRGPKFAAINAKLTQNVDFVILSETKTDPTSLKKRKLKFGLIQTLASSQQGPWGGVIVFSHPKFKLLEGSFRESEDLGHFVCGVYNIHGTNTVLGGVYGRSDNADIACARVMHELNNVISQLKQIFHTNQVIIAGDFNAGRSTSDFSSNQITKARTSGQLESIIHGWGYR